MVTPITAPMLKKAAKVIVLVIRERKIASGINGSRAARSRTANSTHKAAETPSSATIRHEPQG